VESETVGILVPVWVSVTVSLAPGMAALGGVGDNAADGAAEFLSE